LDTNFARNIQIAERFKLTLRGEFFNLTNHVNFGAPNTTLGSAGFGTITSANAARAVQIGLKLYF
jgi:hypothetical protein